MNAELERIFFSFQLHKLFLEGNKLLLSVPQDISQDFNDIVSELSVLSHRMEKLLGEPK